MKFNIDNYKGKFVMHCKTEEEARDFCNYLHEHGRKWYSGTSYKLRTSWDVYQGEMAYAFNKGECSSVGYYKNNGYTILEWSDFTKPFTKADLKTGDVILRRNGWVEIVNCELDMSINRNGWNDLDAIDEDLTNCGGDNEWDIVAVRRPIDKRDCQFNAFEYKWGTLIYDRKRDTVEEMTLAEVCKLLGKNIKIIQ